MRIISPFKDYYDGHQAYDQDKETLFIRKEEELGPELGKWWREVIKDPTHHTYRNVNTLGIIFVAGKGYPYRTDMYLRNPQYSLTEERAGKDDWLYSTKFTLPEEFSKYAVLEVRPPTTFGGYSHKTHINGSLLARDFHKVLSSYEVYQELIMFFNNLSSPEKEMAKLSDKSLAIKHGFDKWSFRRKSL